MHAYKQFVCPHVVYLCAHLDICRNKFAFAFAWGDWDPSTINARSLTVPASLTVRLRAVVVSRDEDPLHRQQLEAEVTDKATSAGLHSFFTQILNQPEVPPPQ